MRRFIFLVWMAGLAAASAQKPASIELPRRAGQSYTDPATGNRVWRVTDSNVCPRGGKHFYSYWPAWNSDGRYLIVQCVGAGSGSEIAVLVRDSDLKILSNVWQDAPAGMNEIKVFWSWKSPEIVYSTRGAEVWSWNPIRKKGQPVARLAGQKVGAAPVYSMNLAYVSFDDRYFLVELQGQNPRKTERNPYEVIGLLTYDRQGGKVIGVLDLTQFGFYDEGVFTRDGKVWVVTGQDSFAYSLDFSTRTRVAESGHHAHGILPNGTPVAVKSASNRECPAGSASGNPRAPEYPRAGWKPTAIILDNRVDTSGVGTNAPLASELFKIGCAIPGVHHFGHFSWNHADGKYFFATTDSYSGFETDPLAFAVLRVRLQFDPNGKIMGDEIDVLAHHRSQPERGYWAQPRSTCNQQATRCLFASSMSVQTINPNPQPHLYVVDVPPIRSAPELKQQ